MTIEDHRDLTNMFQLSEDMEEMIELPNKYAEKLSLLAMAGCKAKKTEHKQWYLEQILDTLGWIVTAVRGEEWEPGVKPEKEEEG